MDSETTFDEDAEMYICNNCGAHSESPESIKHYKTCKPGEAKKWENFYSQANKEETGRW